ncbi:Uncharacterized protein FWK35_00036037, partial [Aphis craccivora]
MRTIVFWLGEVREPPETTETQNNFMKGTNLENETEKMKQLIHLKQNLQKSFKKSDLEHSDKKLNGRVEYTPKKIQKIINLKKNLQNNYRKTVLNDKYTAEEKVKHYEPILKTLSNVESSVNDVKEVAIKTDNDIQKMIPPYKPKNPELQRLMSTEDNIPTPKSSQSSYSYNNSPLPKNIIKLGDLASKYLPKIKDKCFGLYYDEEWDDHYIGKNPLKFENNVIILNGKTYKGTPGLWRLLTYKELIDSKFYTPEDLKIYKEILFETESIYQNNDKSNRNPKSSSSNKYKMMIKPMYNEIKETTNKTKGGRLKKYTDDHIEYCYINNMKQLTDRLQLIAAEKRAGNNNYHNEKLGILQLCKTSME